MNGQTMCFNDITQKTKNVGLDFVTSILGVMYMFLVFIGLGIFKILQGTYFLILGAIAFYFIAGTIGLILCFFLGMLGHAYLGH